MEQEQKNINYEIKSKLTFGNGFDFGFGFGLGFFVANVVIWIIVGFIIFAIFGTAIKTFQKSISDPFGLKGSSYSQPAPTSPQFSFPKLIK